MNIEDWSISEELKNELENHYKTKYSISLVDREAMDIAKALTFDGLANAVTAPELTKFLSALNTRFLNNGIRGVGLEIGSGPGTFVAALATLPNVEKVYGIEACEAIIKVLMGKVVAGIAREHSNKVVGAIADFDHLRLPDKSVDFIFDFFSLHHSPNPAITIKELFRVLKPGGVMLCIDKARADMLTETQLDALLDVEYPRQVKIGMGISPDVVHTRRMNGEHEYRLKDWKKYFTDTGFSSFTHYNVAKIAGSFPARVLKYIFSFLPHSIQVLLSPLFSKRITNNLEPSNRIFTNMFPSYPREFSLMIAYK